MKELITAGLLFVSSPVELLNEKQTYSAEEHVQCLAVNIYHEARDQGTAGKLAVSAVVLNRVNDKRFPNTVCEVVLQAHMKKSWKTGLPIPIRNKCQFSYYCDGKSEKYKELDALLQVIDTSELILKGVMLEQTIGATHYHTWKVSPHWSRSPTFVKLGRVGTHIFYLDKRK